MEQLRLQGTFNSRPHEEVDWEAPTAEYDMYLSTHDLTKRSTGDNVVECPVFVVFQLTTPHGERHYEKEMC